MTDALKELLIRTSPITAIAAFYFVLIQLRRARWKALALNLGAKYISQGPFKTGRLEGSRQGIEFYIATNVKFSSLVVPLKNTGIPFALFSEFFSEPPDWKYAFTVGNNTQRCFFTTITMRHVALRLPDVYHKAVSTRMASVIPTVLSMADTLGQCAFWIHTQGAEFRCSGILKESDRIDAALRVLKEMATEIEKNPITQEAEPAAASVREARSGRENHDKLWNGHRAG